MTDRGTPPPGWLALIAEAGCQGPGQHRLGNSSTTPTLLLRHGKGRLRETKPGLRLDSHSRNPPRHKNGSSTCCPTEEPTPHHESREGGPHRNR